MDVRGLFGGGFAGLGDPPLSTLSQGGWPAPSSGGRGGGRPEAVGGRLG
jgi:hypothetical protein